jgi:hypothetical protein
MTASERQTRDREGERNQKRVRERGMWREAGRKIEIGSGSE